MTVLRETPLPRGAPRGSLVVPRNVADATLRALRGFRGLDGDHEGLVYWAGRVVDPNTYVLSAVVPDCEHEPQRVLAAEAAIGAAARLARRSGLGLVAQIHSHPGNDTRHSEGDDRLVLMPWEGMFSLVVARYGRGSFEDGLGLHQHQDGRWVQIDPITENVLAIVPNILK